jgi:hypothetical protein
LNNYKHLSYIFIYLFSFFRVYADEYEYISPIFSGYSPKVIGIISKAYEARVYDTFGLFSKDRSDLQNIYKAVTDKKPNLSDFEVHLNSLFKPNLNLSDLVVYFNGSLMPSWSSPDFYFEKTTNE